MHILASQYTLTHKALEIYVAGCNGNPHCVGCHNPESWSFNQGDLYTEEYFERIKEKVKGFDNLVKNIFIFGGEPNDQNHDELLHFLTDMKSLNKKLWLFTRYDITEVPEFELILCDYIKTGSYIPDLVTDSNIQHGIMLATSNQHIYKRGLDYEKYKVISTV